jgi:3-phosphoshikimate 1-carboxyvinyltransferase
MIIRPAKNLCGRTRVPGDKSISHRVAIISALAAGRGASRITNFSTADDCAATLECLEQLGIRIERDSNAVMIEGARNSFITPRDALDCRNSGTTMRLLAGALVAQNITATLTGDESLRSRPMRRIIEPLESMGARIESNNGRAPLRIIGRESHSLVPIRYEMPVASAQVKSCVMLAGLGALGRTQIIERGAETRDHTERMLRWFGVPVESRHEKTVEGQSLNVVSIDGMKKIMPRDYSVPGDFSSAAFLVTAAALLSRSELHIADIGLNPNRIEFLETMRAFGASIRINNLREEYGEPRGTIEVSGAERLTVTKGTTSIICGSRTASMIDELPLLAVVGTQIEGGIEIRDAAELRLKETDRIRATADNLRRMDAEIEEKADGLFVKGRVRLRGARLQSFGDHRIAMASTVAALLAEGESEIVGAECVSVSFPEFFTLLDEITQR